MPGFAQGTAVGSFYLSWFLIDNLGAGGQAAQHQQSQGQ
jgi:hypothetical protein